MHEVKIAKYPAVFVSGSVRDCPSAVRIAVLADANGSDRARGEDGNAIPDVVLPAAMLPMTFEIAAPAGDKACSIIAYVDSSESPVPSFRIQGIVECGGPVHEGVRVDDQTPHFIEENMLHSPGGNFDRQVPETQGTASVFMLTQFSAEALANSSPEPEVTNALTSEKIASEETSEKSETVEKQNEDDAKTTAEVEKTSEK